MNERIKYYDIAGIRFSVLTPWEYEDTLPYSLFLTDRRDDLCAEYVYRESDGLPAPRGKLLFEDANYRAYEYEGSIDRYIGCFSDGNVLDPPFALVKRRNTDESHIEVIVDKNRGIPDNSAFIFRTLCTEHLVSAFGGMILHSSYINTERGAILFTAPSETGKSTQAELWRRCRGAAVVNGDCAVIKKTDDGYFAFGLPFAGTSGICSNATSKLCAIVYLVQASEDRAEKISGARAFRAVVEGVKADLWDRRDAKKTAALIEDLVSEVPVYRLECTPDPGAVDELSSILDE